MAKAHITTKSGASVTIEGTPKEVADVMAALESPTAALDTTHKKRVPTTGDSKPTLINLIEDLVDGGFFKKPQGLSAIKIALEEHGFYYPVTTLSPTMLRLVQKRQLRRVKSGNRWAYVG